MPEPQSGVLTASPRSPWMAGVVGFEPTNAWVRVKCLTAWRYPFNESAYRANGVNSGARTHGLQGHNLALHQLSYIHHEKVCTKISTQKVFACLMVHPERLEPPTFTLEGCCSIRLSYGCKTSQTSNTSHYSIIAQKKILVNTSLQIFLIFLLGLQNYF